MAIGGDLKRAHRVQLEAVRRARIQASTQALESLAEGDTGTFAQRLAAYRGLVEREKELQTAARGLGWLGCAERRWGFGLRELHYYAGLVLLALAATWLHPAVGLAVLGVGALAALHRPRPTATTETKGNR